MLHAIREVTRKMCRLRHIHVKTYQEEVASFVFLNDGDDYDDGGGGVAPRMMMK
jgi:hypothetical protein